MDGRPSELAVDRGALRQRLGIIGVRSGAIMRGSAAQIREFAGELEELRVNAFWYPETREVFAQGALLLAASSNLTVCSSIASIYARDPLAAAGGSMVLADAFDGRFVLGLGVSHRQLVEQRGHDYAPPVRAMRDYLDAIDAAQAAARPMTTAPRLLGALGPKMLGLARDRTAGAHPYCVPVQHTSFAREILGPEPLLCVEQSFVLTRDRRAALAASERYIDVHIGFENYRNNLVGLGFDPDRLDADSMLEKLVAWGDENAIMDRVDQHLAAGADHVCIQSLPAGEVAFEHLRRFLAAWSSRGARP
jgi:probable F420-dependent oxidoreductase